MTNKTALILGATSDIGWALAEKLTENGYDVLLAARNTSSLEEKLNTNTKLKKFAPIKFDARNFSSHQTWFASLPVIPELTVCVFGYLGDQKKAEIDWQESQTIIESNYTGAVSILNVISNQYSKIKKGTIVGISSVAGERGRQSNFIYGSAKAGFTAYLSGLRNKLFKDGVHVLTVLPGFMDTKMTAGLNLPKALTAKPKQVADYIYKGIDKKKNTMYVLPIWFWVMLIIKSVPEFVFKKMKL